VNLQRTAGVDYAQAFHMVLLYTFLSFTLFCVLPLVSSRMADYARDILWKMFTVFRSSRRNQQPNSRFAISEGPLAHMGSSLPNPLDTSHGYLEALGHKALLKGRVTNFNDLSESGTNSELMEGTIANLADSTVDGWDIVEHPRLPPPSRSEDVEHWTRAMFIDATK
jgi:hypothetical protein